MVQETDSLYDTRIWNHLHVLGARMRSSKRGGLSSLERVMSHLNPLKEFAGRTRTVALTNKLQDVILDPLLLTCCSMNVNSEVR